MHADIPGVVVRRVDRVPETLEGATRVGPYSVARPGALLRVVPSVGRFLARDGTTIEYCVEAGADRRAVDAVLHGGVLGALIHQRGELPLHATTLVSPDRGSAIALAGHSGAGKSTIAYELTRRGWMLVSDDLTRMTFAGDRPMAWPGRSRLRLTSDACAHFVIDTGPLENAPNWPDKFVLDLPRWESAVPLASVVCLDRYDGPFHIDTLRGAGALALLAEQTYRIHYVEALGVIASHLRLIVALAAATNVRRASGRAAIGDAAGLILQR
jgi:hypothetical protein